MNSLLRLLDDRDASVRGKIRDELVASGEDATPFLEIAALSENPVLRKEALSILEALLPIKTETRLRELGASAEKETDLERGVCIIMQFGYPMAKDSIVSDALDSLASEFSSQLPEQASQKEMAQRLLNFLFVEKGFKGNDADYMNPDNSFINKVLEDKLGIPISLSVLCVLVGQRLKLPIVGVGLPGHYIVKYASLTEPLYFDPFHDGRQLTVDECRGIVERMGYKFEEYHLGQATHRETLMRMLNNLIHTYFNRQMEDKAHQVENLLKALVGAKD
ncbi:MAG: hypothetical protein G3M78_06645 [Candidatus Nitrohelix vancouverensis]|uniref:Protein SirB1 N-terminal domain-containing protein n=1 Tax=Candidatus Nitrohelix vancouverensis TaxID=2705534 RepID=A0A7T0C202_9BACT|nr:MAG: hypothetical protein G3M78_06645 [Candidatus Nitrohelix vancouverensis]